MRPTLPLILSACLIAAGTLLIHWGIDRPGRPGALMVGGGYLGWAVGLGMGLLTMIDMRRERRPRVGRRGFEVVEGVGSEP